MKKTLAVFLLAALTLTVLAGCQSVNAEAPTQNPVRAVSLAHLRTQEPVTPTTAPATQPAPPATQPAVTLLTTQEAEAIALAHAECKAEDVRMERTELDRDDGTLHYDVEFTGGDYEYDYAIDAVTGQVLHWHREYEPRKNQPQPPATQPAPPATQPAPPATQPAVTLLTAQEAEAIALAHAACKAEDVRMERTEQDRENGVQVYEVEFQVGNWEYSYEIHAQTGEILEWEKEFDD